MKGRKLGFIGGAVLLLLLASIIVYSQIGEAEEEITQGEFIDILIQVMGLEELFPEGATLQYKIRFFTDRGYQPLDGWEPDEIITKEDVAVIFVQILRIPGVQVGGFVQELVDRGFMTPGDEDQPFVLDDLVDFINDVSESELSGGAINPYQDPLSPTT